MMNFVTGGRGSGKTTALIYTSAVTGYPIVTDSYHKAEYIKRQAEKLNVKIPQPTCLVDCKKYSNGYNKVTTPVLVDDADVIIERALTEYLGRYPAAAVIERTVEMSLPPKE